MVSRPRLDTVLGRLPSIDGIESAISPRGRRPRANSLAKPPASAPADFDPQPRPSLSRAETWLGRRSRSRPQSQYAPSSFPSPSAPAADEHPDLPNVSVFRNTSQIELHVWSQSVKLTRPPGHETPRPLPVFDTRSKISGTVLLDSGLTANPGRLTVSMEGAFVYISPPSTANKVSGKVPASGMHRHVFFVSSMVIPVERPQVRKRRSSSSIRDAISATVSGSPKLRRQPTQANNNMQGVLRPFPFTLEMPQPGRSGEELPPTFSAVVEGLAGPRGRAYVERSEITYKLIATWESDASGDDLKTVHVEAPIIFEPDHNFESLDGRALDKDAWLEVRLHPERRIPFTCAVALPETTAFSRTSTIPYYVVFTTTPRSPTLAREIVLDATITIALMRQVSIEVAPGSPSSESLSSPSLSSPALTNASTTSLSSGSDEATSFILAHKTRLLKRLVNSAPPRLPRRGFKFPLPRRPSQVVVPHVVEEPEGYTDERTLYTDVYAGFPKRPKLRTEPGMKHPSLNATALLPDGLYKAKMSLHPQMIPSINWADLSVKYYLDVSVGFGQDESRARIPIRIS
ncbi:hypothetical protein FOMPIDRAFT_1133019 [Fomitopsis schrenkii]|uniref:Uncharacterized protein n=1 Tax=Fomitopsis schrenkii TaxID=2126942 RepID=S8DV79_FOMSC|nr:hypothetical protein FOMPIDRAFT_1133019 [Fomitopsis schrenkii]